MIILGLLLLIVAAAFGLDLIWKNHYAIRSPALLGQTLSIHNAAEYFIVGAVTGAVLILGIALILAGIRHKGTKARQHRAQRKDAKNTRRDRDQVRRENERLHQRLDHDETSRDPGAGASSSGATATD